MVRQEVTAAAGSGSIGTSAADRDESRTPTKHPSANAAAWLARQAALATSSCIRMPTADGGAPTLPSLLVGAATFTPTKHPSAGTPSKGRSADAEVRPNDGGAAVEDPAPEGASGTPILRRRQV